MAIFISPSAQAMPEANWMRISGGGPQYLIENPCLKVLLPGELSMSNEVFPMGDRSINKPENTPTTLIYFPTRDLTY